MSLTSILELDQEIFLQLDFLDLLNASKISKYYYYIVCIELFYKSKLRPWFDIIPILPKSMRYKTLYFMAIKKSDEDLLSFAAKYNAAPLVRKLMNENIPVSDHVIIDAAKGGSVEIFQELWKFWGLTHKHTNILFGDSGAIVSAAAAGKFELLSMILHIAINDGNPTHHLSTLKQALNMSCRNSYYDISQLLLLYIKDPESTIQGFLNATSNGYIDIMALIISKGLDINYMDPQWISRPRVIDTALTYASLNGHTNAVKFLLNCRNGNYMCDLKSAMNAAAENDRCDIVKILQEELDYRDIIDS